jgi:isopenicillin-N N-acyltransferase-like protein
MRDVTLGEDGGCSIIFSPGISGPILGQTWDIHGTALPYVVVLKYKDCIIFSITGCLGMTGINRAGVALAINNLASIDARPGLMWPAAVRKALRGSSAAHAKDEIMNMQTGSGRHYAIADKNNFYGIETSGTKKKIIHNLSDEVYFHTNHCLDKEMFRTHKIAKDSTTIERFRFLDEEARHQDLKSPSKVFLALAGVGMTVNKDHPQNTATCGTIVMDIANHSMLACPGIASNEQLLNPNTTIHF